MKKRQILIGIQDKGEVLVLLDDRRLRVRPEDLPTSSMWIPMEELEISDESNDPVYTLRVLNIEENKEIFAMWI